MPVLEELLADLVARHGFLLALDCDAHNVSAHVCAPLDLFYGARHIPGIRCRHCLHKAPFLSLRDSSASEPKICPCELHFINCCKDSLGGCPTCRATGCSLPTFTLPMWTVLVGLRTVLFMCSQYLQVASEE